MHILYTLEKIDFVRSVEYYKEMRPNEERNKQIVSLRDSDPKTYSFRELGRIFKIREATVHEIYYRDRKKYKPVKAVRSYPQSNP